MKPDQELKKEGIEIIKPLDRLTINMIAKLVADRLVMAFPNQNLNVNHLFMQLSRLNMYIARIASPIARAKYDHKTRSIYFHEDVDFTHIDVYTIHECIHALQERRDEKGNLLRLGLCDFTTSRLHGMALNEAAVQFMSSVAIGPTLDTVKYFDITLPTYSPSCYALECTLLNQMLYFTGTYDLFHSTLYSNDLFMDKFVLLTTQNTFYRVQSNLDTLINLEDEVAFQLSLLSNMEGKDKTIVKINNKITKLRMQIQSLFFDTQNLLLTSYFDKKFQAISTLVQIEDYRKKLYHFKDVIGYTSTYSFYHDYYVKKMADLEEKRNQIEEALLHRSEQVWLVPHKRTIFSTLFCKLRTLFRLQPHYEKQS